MSSDRADDAAVVRFANDSKRGLVLTADVIAPLVDDAETFGRIAATNAISDVYAMGGTPRFALNLMFFPDDQLPLDILADILRGGARACADAGVAMVGGHTVRDPELKYGLSVTGEVDRSELLSNQTAAAGQRLVLSKALGTGVVGQAIKKQVASDAERTAAIASMTTHNRDALLAARRHGVTAATDVTGFGLLGHLRNILRGSGLAATIELGAVPLLPGALEHAEAGLLPGGSAANLAFLEPSLRRSGQFDPPTELLVRLACDAQTSGGLLLCVPDDRAGDLLAELVEGGHSAAVIGSLSQPPTGDEPGAIHLRR